MVAVINSGRSISRTFYYNENKLAEGAADLLMAHNYPMDLEQMNQQQRLQMLLKTAAQRPTVKRPGIHISLNFPPSEKHKPAFLQQIIHEYMQAIGFGEQPYLAYTHFDAAHPHIHIVTLRVRPNGDTIDTFNIGRNQSEKARRMLEGKYNLVRAEDHKGGLFQLPAVQVEKATYSQSLTKRAIVAVLDRVLPHYKYRSLEALNAVLKGYNICADRGSEQSRVYKNKGLVYRLLDVMGKPVGVPIPASHIFPSHIPVKPTLKYLKERFAVNDSFSKAERQRVKTAVDTCLLKPANRNLLILEKVLLKQQIRLVLRRNTAGQLYGLTYIDHQNKCVFNGADLGKEYSANAIQRRCGIELMPAEKQASIPLHPPQNPAGSRITEPDKYPDIAPLASAISSNSVEPLATLFEQLLQPEQVYEALPYALKRNKKRKKKRKPNHL